MSLAAASREGMTGWSRTIGQLRLPAAGSLGTPLLGSLPADLGEWVGGSGVRHVGCVRYRVDGPWLRAVAQVDDRDGGLQAASQRAYAELFRVLAEGDHWHPLRFWNYLAGINREEGGSERYRQFNAGRQQAFLDAGRAAFDGAPAACALGSQGGPLRVHLLAGPSAPVPIENPRQVSAYRYPVGYGPRSPSFSRAALVDAGGGRRVLLVSGTASIVGHATLHVGDVARQAAESLLNIATLLAVAADRQGPGFAMEHLVCTVYLRHATDLAIVREVLERTVGARATRAALWFQADICRADLLVEIEAHAMTPYESTTWA